MSKRRSKNIVGTLATVIILIAIIVTVVLLVQRHKEDLEDLVNPNFAVVYNNKSYRGKINGVSLPEEGQATFSIKNVATATVKIVPNYDFTYTVDGTEHHFTEHEDLTNVFVEKKNIFADYFVINCVKGGYSVENVLKSFYEADAEVLLPELTRVYPYRLVVTSNTGDEIWLSFGQGDGWTFIDLSYNHIIF